MSSIPATPKRDRWAHLRFSIVGPLLAAPPEPGQLYNALRELATKTWRHPLSGTDVRFAAATIERWFYAARNAGDPVNRLRDRRRGDRGTFHSLAPEVIAALRTQYQAHPGWTVQLHFDNLKVALRGTGTENSGWLDAWAPAPSVYAVKARHAGDVAACVTFARENKLRLVVKGGGHSYLGTSNAPDSLLIWTRAMNKVSLHDAFVGKGCAGRVAPVPAVSAGAGAMWMDLYQAVTTEGGRYVQGGSCTTVGVAGLVQSGGFNSFSKGFGTAAAGLLEAKVVTADGQVRIVNECNDPDLFWAIKGGGGGTFGVIARVTLRTHDLPPFFGAAWGEIKARSDEAFVRLIAYFIGFYHETLFNPHWGEHVHFRSDNVLEISMISQGLAPKQTLAAWQPFFDWVTASPNDFVVLSPLGAWAWDARAWWDLDKSPSMVRDTCDGAPKHHGWGKGDQGEVGIFLHGYTATLLPATELHQLVPLADTTIYDMERRGEIPARRTDRLPRGSFWRPASSDETCWRRCVNETSRLRRRASPKKPDSHIGPWPMPSKFVAYTGATYYWPAAASQCLMTGWGSAWCRGCQ